MSRVWSFVTIVAVSATTSAFAQTPIDGAFTYQGQLKDQGQPASGPYDMQFRLYAADAGGMPLATYPPGGPMAVTVQDGLFTAIIDFGTAVFNGERRWLEIVVEGTTLSPRQELTVAPYALYALNGPGGESFWQSSATGIYYSVGNVGIGADPSADHLLEVAGGDVLITRAGGGAANLIINDSDGGITPPGIVFWNNSESAFYADDQTDEIFAFRAGYPTPRVHDVHLRVYGHEDSQFIDLTHDGDDAIISGASGDLVLYGTGSNPAMVVLNSGTTGDIRFYTGGAIPPANESMLIDPSGNVGIGTGSPQAKLHVGGTPGTDGIMFPDGTLQTTAAAEGEAGWSLTGNAGTVPGTNFVGTTDNQPLELRVNNTRALTLTKVTQAVSSPPYIWHYTGVNVLAGSPHNSISSDVTAATISGGGYFYEEFGTAAANTVTAMAGTVGGGGGNTASGFAATVSGGCDSEASGRRATVPGGSNNSAGGDYSFAAGQRAKVRTPFQVGGGDTDGDEGTFAWADSTDADFTSTGPDQFLIRATGGVGINTNEPTSPLTVDGVIESLAGGFRFPDGTLQASAATGGASLWHSCPGGIYYSAGSVGIGTASPGEGLNTDLDIVGRTSHRTNPNDLSKGLIIDTSGTRHRIYSDALSGTPYDLILGTYPNGHTDQLVLLQTGDVGIGTDAPDNQLTVDGDADFTGNVGIGTATPVNKLDVEGSVAIGASYSGTSAAPANGLIVQGNVGINTTGPQERIEVNAGFLGVDSGSGGDLTGIRIRENDALRWTILYRTWQDDDLEFLNESLGAAAIVLKADTNNVGIGVSDPSEKLDTSGTIRLRGIGTSTGTTVVADANGKLWKQSSSLRYKHNVTDLPVAGDAVLDLRPVSFDWNSTAEPDIGLIAEEVETVLPDLVIRDADGRPDGVRYDKLALYLMGVVKDQREQIGAQRAQIKAQQDELSELQARLEKIEALLAGHATQPTGGVR